MEYIVDDQGLEANVFISLANSVWPGRYDVDKTQKALKKQSILQLTKKNS